MIYIYIYIYVYSSGNYIYTVCPFYPSLTHNANLAVLTSMEELIGIWLNPRSGANVASGGTTSVAENAVRLSKEVQCL